MAKARTLRIGMLVLLLLNVGCVAKTYSNLKPVQPKTSYLAGPKTVESLTPRFVWKKSEDPEATYDFAIFPHMAPGRVSLDNPLYYREALSTNEHTVEVPLSPETYYLWTVRTRKHGRISRWSTFNSYQYFLFAYRDIMNWLFPFCTPTDT